MLACPGNRAYCYRELAVSYIAVSVTIARTLCHGGMARLGIPGWLVKYQDGIPVSSHPSYTNLA